MFGVKRPNSRSHQKTARSGSSVSDIYVLAGVQCLGFLLGAVVVYVIYGQPFETAPEAAPKAAIVQVERTATPVKVAAPKRQPWSVSAEKQNRLETSYQERDDLAGKALAVVFEPVPVVERAPAARTSGRPLSKFFSELAALEAGARVTPITIVHLGDSHIASDSLSRGIRRRLQERFGDAGRGMMVPAGAYKYAIADGVSFKRTGNWTASNSLRQKSGPYGISGVRLSSRSKGASLRLTARSGQFDWAEVTVLTGPKQGTVRLKAGDKVVTFNARAKAQNSRVVRLNARGVTVTVTAGEGGATTVLNWAIGRNAPGVRYVNFGIAGATANITDRWSRQLVANDIAHLKPDLIIWGYGTNEGFNDGLDLARYEKTVSRFIGQLRGSAPDAEFMFIGPADSARAPRHARGSKVCRHLAAGDTRKVSRWHAPPKLGKVRSLLADLSKAQNAAFWDWYSAMGGSCSINRWATASPALAARDRVHLTNRGYDRSAALFIDHLMNRFSQSRLVAATQQ